MIPFRTATFAATVLFASGILRAASADDQAKDALTVHLTANRTQVAVAEPFSVTLSATAPEDWDIQLPEIPSRFGELRVTRVGTPVDQHRSGEWTRSAQFEMEAFLPGRHRIEPLTVGFSADPQPSAGTAVAPIERMSEPTVIRVRSSQGLFGASQLREIDGPVRVPWTRREWIAAVALFASLGLGAFAVFGAFRRWRATRPLTQRRLLRDLERLDQARLDRSLTNDKLAVASAELLRSSLQLIERPRRIHRTTDEWLEYLASNATLQEFTEPAAHVFHTADAVKFAGRTLSGHEARSCLEAAIAIVRQQVETAPAGGPQR